MEEWRDIPGYEGIYEASNQGRIRTKAGKITRSAIFPKRVWKQRILKQKKHPNKKGRIDARVCLWKNGEEKTWLVSRLIALTWCEGYAPDMTVNHKDGDHLNNDASNLEWISLKENIRQGFKDGLYASKMKPVTLYRNGYEYRFSSLSETSRFLGRCHGYVHYCIKQGKTTLTNNKGEVFRIERKDEKG